ncbi:hypothetical protein CGRA01v4_03718 [Colletotrichum graminicola]|nr:hypothetical protein CGRA01v4_03718 [Colletotrichum graminicola]
MHHPLPASAAWADRVSISERDLECSEGGVFSFWYVSLRYCTVHIFVEEFAIRSSSSSVTLPCSLSSQVAHSPYHRCSDTWSFPVRPACFVRQGDTARPQTVSNEALQAVTKVFSVAVVSGARARAGDVSSNRGRLTYISTAASSVSGDHHPPLRRPYLANSRLAWYLPSQLVATHPRTQETRSRMSTCRRPSIAIGRRCSSAIVLGHRLSNTFQNLNPKQPRHNQEDAMDSETWLSSFPLIAQEEKKRKCFPCHR